MLTAVTLATSARKIVLPKLIFVANLLCDHDKPSAFHISSFNPHNNTHPTSFIIMLQGKCNYSFLTYEKMEEEELSNSPKVHSY